MLSDTTMPSKYSQDGRRRWRRNARGLTGTLLEHVTGLRKDARDCPRIARALFRGAMSKEFPCVRRPELDQRLRPVFSQSGPTRPTLADLGPVAPSLAQMGATRKQELLTCYVESCPSNFRAMSESVCQYRGVLVKRFSNRSSPPRPPASGVRLIFEIAFSCGRLVKQRSTTQVAQNTLWRHIRPISVEFGPHLVEPKPHSPTTFHKFVEVGLLLANSGPNMAVWVKIVEKNMDMSGLKF